jgi:alanine racemase
MLRIIPVFQSLPDDFRGDILLRMDNSSRSTWLEIDLNQIRNNIHRLQEITRRPVVCVVKANGYGHGLVEISRTAVEAGAPMLSVARIEEALVLREHSITAPILVMGYTRPDWAEMAVRHEIRLTVYDWETACLYSELAQSAGGRLKVHIKVDTGMGRLGFQPHTDQPTIERLFSLPGLEIEGIYTHFARADEPAEPVTCQQIDAFEQVLDGLKSTGHRPSMIHASNSAGALNFPQAAYDAVRCGIAIYGLNPSDESPLPAGFQPALTWKTRLSSIKEFRAGSGISYGHHYVTSKAERIGVIAAGYADGYRRINGNVALIQGVRVPVVGSVCMDQSMLQLDSVPNAQIGDEVVLLGAQGDERISAEELGKAWGTIDYEVVCGLSARLPRIYSGLS